MKKKVLAILDQWYLALDKRYLTTVDRDHVAAHMRNAIEGVRSQVRDLRTR